MKKIQQCVFLYCLTACLFFISLAVWSLASPVGSAPDEDFHQTMIYCAAGKASSCLDNGTRYGHCYTMRPTVAGSCKNYADLVAPVATMVNSSTVLPIYHKVAQFFVSDTLGETTLKIRLMNVFMTIILATVSLLLTARPYKIPVFLSLVLCTVPSGLFFLSSISPSAWAIISVAFLAGPLYSMIRKAIAGQSTNSVLNGKRMQLARFLFVGLLITIGVGSRYETLIWIPLVALFAVIANLYDLPKIKFSIKIWGLAAIFIVASAGALVFLFVERSPFSLKEIVSNFSGNLISWWVFEKSFNTLFGVMSLTGIPGAELGTHDAPISPIASFFIAVAIGGALLSGLSKAERSHIVIFVMFVLTLFFITAVLWSAMDWDYYQSRYFLPIFYFMIFLCLRGQSVQSFVAEKKYWLLILFSASVAYSLTLLSTILRFVYGLEFQQTRFPLGKESIDINPARLLVAPIPEWWLTDIIWLTPFLIWIVGSISFLGAVFLGWLTLAKMKNANDLEVP